MKVSKLTAGIYQVACKGVEYQIAKWEVGTQWNLCKCVESYGAKDLEWIETVDSKREALALIERIQG